MEWNTNDNDQVHAADNQHTTLHNSNLNDFANINTNTYDLNQFNQLINLNNSGNHQELIHSNNSIHIIHNRSSINQNDLQDVSRLDNLATSSNLSKLKF